MLLNRYLYRTIAKPLFLGIGGATFLLLIDTLSELIDKIVVRGIPFPQVMELLSYHMVHLLSFTVPMGMMIGSLIAYGSMSNENEIIALNSLGIRLLDIIKPIFFLSSIICTSLLLVNQFITPIAAQRQEDIGRQLAFERPSLGLAEKQFVTSIKGYAIYLDSFNGYSGESGTFILFSNNASSNFPSVIRGRNASWDQGYMNIRNAKAYEMDERGVKKSSIEFGEQKIPIKNKVMDIDFMGIGNAENQMSLTALLSTIMNRKERGLPSLSYQLALHTKLSLAFSAIVLALLGTLLSVGIHKRFKRGDGKLTGIAVLFLYWVWIMSSRGIINNNGFPAYIMWGPNVFFLLVAIAIFLYKRKA